jgi:Siphovirus ReqiPepy6 Gp37-like protein
MSIETWVTTATGVYVQHLERSKSSPFRNFAVSRRRGADPGVGSLEYGLDNALLRANPALFAFGNLVWMRYRGVTQVWVIEDHQTVLDAQEHATDWVRVVGRGSKQLIADRLAWPTAFADTPTGRDPSKWGKDNQWRRVVNRASGEMLWDLIDASNGRPGFAPITRGTIETTGADGWTQDLRFDNLLDVVADVTNAYGEIELDGLEFNYWNAPGTDRSATVIFEESADILRVERTTSDRDTVTYAIAEGVGEGVTAKLAIAQDTTATRRREAYVDAKDAGNLPLVQLRADATLAELRKADAIALEVTEERFAALSDYDLWDTVRVIAPSRGIDESAVIVALYLAETDDERVRVGVDVNTPRQEALLRLEEGQRSVRRSVGIRNRQPQGQLTPYAFNGGGQFDTDDTAEAHVWIPDRVSFVVRAEVAVMIRPFKAPAKAATSSGTLTSNSGGGSTSGSSSASSSNDENIHKHLLATLTSATGGTVAAQGSVSKSGGGSALIELKAASADLPFGMQTAGGEAHNHGIPHTHSTPNHAHDVPGHTHGLDYGIQSEAMPGSWSVTLTVYERVGASWTLRGTFAGLTAEDQEVDLTTVITGPGRWRLDLQSAAGQPNGGRLFGYLSGFVEASIQSA